MSYKGSTRMAEYMRQWRATKSGKISVNRKSINHFNPPNLIGSSSLSNFGILYRNGEDDFTLANPAGDRDRSMRSLNTGIFEWTPELCSIRILRDGKVTMGVRMCEGDFRKFPSM